MANFLELQDKIGYEFKQEKLLRQALTHSSFANEKHLRKHSDNERLEFLGDAVLEIVSSDFLYKAYPDKSEGDLTKLAEADVEFHEIIYRAAENKRLLQVLNNLREQIYRYRIEYLKDEKTRNRLVMEHREMYEAIRDRDIEKAKKIASSHIENQRKGIIESIHLDSHK